MALKSCFSSATWTLMSSQFAGSGSPAEGSDVFDIPGPGALLVRSPSASHHLPRVGLSEAKDVRDVTVCIVERLSKDERGPFRGRQLFQQQPDPTAAPGFVPLPTPGRRSYRPVPAARGRTYVSRRERADCMTLIANRVAIVLRNAVASRTGLRSAVCQRTQTSWTMSSASAALPSIL